MSPGSLPSPSLRTAFLPVFTVMTAHLPHSLLMPVLCPHPAGFMLPNPDEAVIWRGPRCGDPEGGRAGASELVLIWWHHYENSEAQRLIKHFLQDVPLMPLDYLVIDVTSRT